MPDIERHLEQLDRRITELSDALAGLGRGADLQELLRIIRQPGWATPAELTFGSAILDSMRVQGLALERLNRQLLAGARRVGTDPMNFELDIDDTLEDRLVPHGAGIHPNQGNVRVT